MKFSVKSLIEYFIGNLAQEYDAKEALKPASHSPAIFISRKGPEILIPYWNK